MLRDIALGGAGSFNDFTHRVRTYPRGRYAYITREISMSWRFGQRFVCYQISVPIIHVNSRYA
jgi:hypothetical protein